MDSPHSLSVPEVAAALRVDASQGLPEGEVAGRRAEHGANVLEERNRVTWPRVLARQFTEVLVAILIVAALVSAFVGEPVDALAILFIVLVNGLLGFLQEWRAEQAMSALQAMLSPKARVLRGGAQRELPASELVVGDLVQLGIGDRVPADLRLVEVSALRIDESALTGESSPVGKQAEPVAAHAALAERRCLALMGTAVTAGRGAGLVVSVGMATELGQVATMTQDVRGEATPLQRKLARLGRQLGLVSILVALLTGLAGVLVGRPPMEMFLTAVALAVAVVPEGLPAVVTLTLALGIRAMHKRRVLLRRLQAAEGLGEATIICSDKTGTLTQNQMTVQELWLASGTLTVEGVGYSPQGAYFHGDSAIEVGTRPDLLRLLEAGLACSDAKVQQVDEEWKELGEPTEAALVVAARKAGLEAEGLPPRQHEIAFDSARKRMTVVLQEAEGSRAVVKGAPELILPRCVALRVGEAVEPMGPERAAQLLEHVEEMSMRGLRCLAIAERSLPEGLPMEADVLEQELCLLGIVGMIDPPRPEVPAAIATAREAGIRTLMITGDAPGTALAVARRIGLSAQRALTGPEVDALDEAGLKHALRGDPVFARTTPAHKLRIVTALQQMGEVVAMTGDGVNDAAALKQADVGIAMGRRGTEVARGAAKMILLDDNYASIVGAVEEGRRQYDNIQKFVLYLLSSNLGEVVAIVGCLSLGWPLILLPIQILWMNLVTDGVTALALGTERAGARLMQRPPRRPGAGIVGVREALHLLALGLWIGGASLWLFTSPGDPDGNLDHARTMAFAGMVMIEKMNVLSFRSLGSPWFAIGFLRNPWLLLAWASVVALQIGAIYLPPMQAFLHTVPLSLGDWGLIAAVALPIFLVPELLKTFAWALRRRKRAAGLG